MIERETSVAGVPDDCGAVEETQPVFRGSDGMLEDSRYIVCVREDCDLINGLGVEGFGETEKEAIEDAGIEVNRALKRDCIALRTMQKSIEELF